jgi:hypothetical protein
MNHGEGHQMNVTDVRRCTVMQNGFRVANGDDACITFLFVGWSVDNRTKYAIMLIGVLLMGFLNGFLIYIRQVLAARSKGNSSILLNQLLLSLVYGVQIVLAYWLMLLVMTYETGLFIMLIIGLVLGHFFFGYVLARSSSKASSVTPNENANFQNQFNSTPCCQTMT